MVVLVCQTCKVSLDDNLMQKHIRDQRHRGVKHEPTGLEFCCEKCSVKDVHQLAIMRSVPNKISMLCTSCAKKDRASNVAAKYTIGNGSLLKYCDGYFKLKGLRCGFCNKKKMLGTMRGMKLISCKNCVEADDVQHFVPMNHPQFIEIFMENHSKVEKVEYPKFIDKSTGLEEDVGSLKITVGKTKSGSSLDYLPEDFDFATEFADQKPVLAYESVSDYQQTMSYNLYLEAVIEAEAGIEAEFLQSREIKWNDSTEEFTACFLKNEKLMKHVPKRLRAVGKGPFSRGQAVFVTVPNDKQAIWSCLLTNIDIDKNSIPQRIYITGRCFNWYSSVVKSGLHGKSVLNILPCSVPVSRVLTSLEQVGKTSFVDLILGQKHIEQKFSNSVTLKHPLTAQLNHSQKSAISYVLNNTVSVLRGPPGTGKTSTIHQLILQYAKEFSRFPILVVAASNVAIDNIAEKFLTIQEFKPLRIVSQMKESEYKEDHNLFPICLHSQTYGKLKKHNKVVYDDYMNGKVVSEEDYKSLMRQWFSIAEPIVEASRIIFTTTSGAGSGLLSGDRAPRVPIVIMDESTQSSEAFSLIPLTLKGVSKFVFVGDEKQLSAFSDIPFLAQSLFERILRNGTYQHPHILDTQYRMHPNILSFSIKHFYNGKLSDGITSKDRVIDKWITALTFLDTGTRMGRENAVASDVKGTTSYENLQEVDVVLDVIIKLLRLPNISHNDIGVITPYAAQRDALSNAIQRNGIINPEGLEIKEQDDIENIFERNTPTVKIINGLMVSSIDAFQGREKKIIIFSCVRSNNLNRIGFLKDPRRLNVALTRAQFALIMVGDKTCLRKGNDLWAELIQHFERNGRMIAPHLFII